MTDTQTPGEPPPEVIRTRCLAVIVPVLLLAIGVAHAQGTPENPPVKKLEGDTIAPPAFAGIFFGYASGRHQTSILDEISCGKGAFTDATASHIPYGIFFDFPFPFDRSVRILSRFTLARHRVSLPGSRFRYEYLAGGIGETDTAESITELHADLRTTTTSLGVAWDPLGIGLQIGLEGTLSLVTGAEERRTERYTAPSDVRFRETNSPERELPIADSVSFREVIGGLDFSVGYRLRASRRLLFFPQIRFGASLTSFADDASWSLREVTPTLGIGYDLGSDIPPAVTPPPVITPPQPPDTTPLTKLPVLAATVVAKGIDENGREYDDPAIEIQEAPWSEVVPILPMIFFDSGSAAIPGRYMRLAGPDRADRFSVDSLVGVTPIDIHWQLLNIVGERMRNDRTLSMTVVGTGSLDERSEESGLGTARAKNIVEYLEAVWGIDPSRIRILSAARPQSPSNEDREEGREENRRVELRFAKPSAGGPVVIHRLAVVASPPAVKFDTDITADTALASWNVTVAQGEKELLRFQGGSSAGSLEQSKLWPLTDLRISKDMTPIRYRLEVLDVIGQRATDSGTFRVIERVTRLGADSLDGRVELFGYNLVGFDYDSAELLPRQLAELKEIARAASAQAQMTIVGYTDRVGSPERNERLSVDRARAVRDAISAEQRRLALPEAKSVTVQGLGQRRENFNNDLPEGRILSRMVLVTISKLRSK